MGDENPPATGGADTTQQSVLEIPSNINFEVSAAIGQLIYQNLIIENVKGKLIIKDNAIRMQDVMMQMLDGVLSMNGGYSSEDLKHPSFDFSLNVKDFDIRNAKKILQLVYIIAQQWSG